MDRSPSSPPMCVLMVDHRQRWSGHETNVDPMNRRVPNFLDPVSRSRMISRGAKIVTSIVPTNASTGSEQRAFNEYD